MATQRLCSIPGCGKPNLAKKMCGMHYARFKKYGDPLQTKTSPGAPADFYLNVVLKYEGNDCLPWPFSQTDGYGVMVKDGRPVVVSRALCEEVNGPPPTLRHQSAHSCGNGSNGCVTKAHVSWKTPQENIQDKLLHGTHNRGERCASSKLCEAQVRQIRSRRGIETQEVLSKRYGVSTTTISAIQLRKKWAWIDEPNSDDGLAKVDEAV